MKKFMLPILLFLMFIPFVVNAETCDTDKITIENITIDSKSNNVEELDEATANGKNITLNLSMSEVGDNIEYKFTVKNDSNEDYELDKTTLNLNSDYINYSFETEDNSNIVKTKSSKSVTLRVEYKTEVPEDKFESETYTDSKTMTVQLSNENTINVPDTFKNPNTGVQSYILIVLILLLLSGNLYILLKKKKYAKFMILIIGTAILIPMSVYALCKCEIFVNSNVLIKDSKRTVYVTSKQTLKIGEEIPTTIKVYESPDEIISSFPSHIKHILKNEKIVESYLNFSIENTLIGDHSELSPGRYSLRGGDNGINYENNKEILRNAFGENNCSEYEEYFQCSLPLYAADMKFLIVSVNNDGSIGAINKYSSCGIANDGSSSCNIMF